MTPTPAPTPVDDDDSLPQRMPLSLRFAGSAVHAPAAWFIAGGDARVWLEELSRWGVALGGARLYPLPHSAADRRTSGVLVTFSGGPGQAGAVVPRADARLRAEAFGCLGGVLYVPVNARLYPETTAAELRAALAYDVCVLHPATGLAGFKFSDAVTVASLLEPPRRRRGVWNRARPGAAPHAHLVAVEPESVPSLQSLLENARGDIGSQSLTPAAPGENPAGESRGMMERLAAGMSRLFAPLLGGSGGDSARLSGSTLEESRSKELDRLLEMFDKNPDEGLRHAIPFGAQPSRGLARPGGQLVPHTIDFQIGRIRGAGAADYWSIPPEIQAQLRMKYFEAANRELSLGRHRRAAYIFAELLGEHAAAASALKQGRHFREAAVVYRDMLKNNVMAAECLTSGGLIAEAIVIREELAHWIEAGRLYEMLDQPEQARTAYHHAVKAELQERDFTAAVKILLNRLDEPETALRVLEEAWPFSAQAKACLHERFALLGRLGRHAAAGTLIQSLRGEELTHEQSQHAVEALALASSNYPDAPQRAKAADAARVLAGTRLARVPLEQAREFAASIAALAREDRLLARDGQRYIEQRRALERAGAKAPLPQKSLVKKRFKLPGAAWKTAVSATGDIFYAIGIARAGEAIFLRGLWDESRQIRGWPVKPRHALRLEPPRMASQPVLAIICAGERAQFLNMRTLAETETFKTRTSVGTPAWLPGKLAGFCYNEHGSVYTITEREGDATLSLFGSNEMLLAQFPMERPGRRRPDQWLPMVARNEFVFATDGASKLSVFFRGAQESIAMSGPIKGLAATTPFTKLRVAVALEEGGMLLWPTLPKRAPSCRFAEGMIRPVAAFTRGGMLIAANEDEIRIYSTENETLRKVTQCRGPGAPPIAVVPAEGLDEFAVFLENGEVLVQGVP